MLDIFHFIYKWINDSDYASHKKKHVASAPTPPHECKKPERERVLKASGHEKPDRKKITTDDVGDWCWEGAKRISVCPPLCHPHLLDHITNRAFSKQRNKMRSVGDQ